MEAAPGTCRHQLTGKKENLEHSTPWPSLSHLGQLRVGDPLRSFPPAMETHHARAVWEQQPALRENAWGGSQGVAGPALLPVPQRWLLTAPPQGRPHLPLGPMPGAFYSAQGSERETALVASVRQPL